MLLHFPMMPLLIPADGPPIIQEESKKVSLVVYSHMSESQLTLR